MHMTLALLAFYVTKGQVMQSFDDFFLFSFNKQSNGRRN